MISQTNAISNPRAVMVHFQDAKSTNSTVMSSRRFDIFTFCAPFELVSVFYSVVPTSNTWIRLNCQKGLVRLALQVYMVLRIWHCNLAVLPFEVVILLLVVLGQFGGCEEVVNVAWVGKICSQK
jgi:hypothetical protein